MLLSNLLQKRFVNDSMVTSYLQHILTLLCSLTKNNEHDSSDIMSRSQIEAKIVELFSILLNARGINTLKLLEKENVGNANDILACCTLSKGENFELNDIVHLNPQHQLATSTDSLNDLLTIKSNVLIYGAAGTGKSSLIKSSLALHFYRELRYYCHTTSSRALQSRIIKDIHDLNSDMKNRTVGDDALKVAVVLDGPFNEGLLHSIFTNNCTKSILLMETCSISDASPSLFTSFSMLHVQHTAAPWSWGINWFESTFGLQMQNNVKCKSMIKSWSTSLCAPVFDLALSLGMRKSRISTLYVSMQNLCKASSIESQQLHEGLLSSIFIFVAIWALGGCMNATTRTQFSEGIWRIVEEQIDFKIDLGLPPSSYLYDFKFDVHSNRWVPWMNTLPSSDMISVKGLTYYQSSKLVLLRRNEALALLYFSTMNLNMVLVGHRGCGSSTLVSEAIKLQQGDLVVDSHIRVNFTPFKTDYKDYIHLLLKTSGKDQTRPTCIILEDIHLGPKHATENFRQLLDSEKWYSEIELQNGRIPCTQMFGTGKRIISKGMSRICDRFLRYFMVLEVSDMPVDHVYAIYAMAGEHLSTPAAMLLEIGIFSTIHVCQHVYHLEKPLIVGMDVKRIGRIVRQLLQCIECQCPSKDEFGRLWAHECAREFIDSLFLKGDREKMEKHLHAIAKSSFGPRLASVVKHIASKTPLLFSFALDGAAYTEVLCLDSYRDLIQVELQTHIPQLNEEPWVFDDFCTLVSRLHRGLKLSKHMCLFGENSSYSRYAIQAAAILLRFRLKTMPRIEASSDPHTVITKWNSQIEMLRDGTMNKTVLFINNAENYPSPVWEALLRYLETGIIPLVDNEIVKYKNKNDYFSRPFPQMLNNEVYFVLQFECSNERFGVFLNQYPTIINHFGVHWNSSPSKAMVEMRLRSCCEPMKPLLNSYGINLESTFKCYLLIQRSVTKYLMANGRYSRIAKRFLPLWHEAYRKEVPKLILSQCNTYIKEMKSTQHMINGYDTVVKKVNALHKEQISMQAVMRRYSERASSIENLDESEKLVKARLKLSKWEKKLRDCIALMNQQKQAIDDAYDNIASVYADVKHKALSLSVFDLRNWTSEEKSNSQEEIIFYSVKALVQHYLYRVDSKFRSGSFNMRKISPALLLKVISISGPSDLPSSVYVDVQIFQQYKNISFDEVSTLSPSSKAIGKYVKTLIEFASIHKASPENIKSYLELLKDIDSCKHAIILRKNELQQESERTLLETEELHSIRSESQCLEFKTTKVSCLLKALEDTQNGMNRVYARSTSKLRKIEATKQYLPGNALVGACIRAYMGFVALEDRGPILQVVCTYLEKSNIWNRDAFHIDKLGNRDIFSLTMYPETPESLLQNYFILSRSTRIPLLVDPERIATEWIQRSFTSQKRRFKVIDYRHRNVAEEMRTATETNTVLLIEGLRSHFPSEFCSTGKAEAFKAAEYFPTSSATRRRSYLSCKKRVQIGSMWQGSLFFSTVVAIPFLSDAWHEHANIVNFSSSSLLNSTLVESNTFELLDPTKAMQVKLSQIAISSAETEVQEAEKLLLAALNQLTCSTLEDVDVITALNAKCGNYDSRIIKLGEKNQFRLGLEVPDIVLLLAADFGHVYSAFQDLQNFKPSCYTLSYDHLRSKYLQFLSYANSSLDEIRPLNIIRSLIVKIAKYIRNEDESYLTFRIALRKLCSTAESQFTLEKWHEGNHAWQAWTRGKAPDDSLGILAYLDTTKTSIEVWKCIRKISEIMGLHELPEFLASEKQFLSSMYSSMGAKLCYDQGVNFMHTFVTTFGIKHKERSQIAYILANLSIYIRKDVASYAFDDFIDLQLGLKLNDGLPFGQEQLWCLIPPKKHCWLILENPVQFTRSSFREFSDKNQAIVHASFIISSWDKVVSQMENAVIEGSWLVLWNVQNNVKLAMDTVAHSQLLIQKGCHKHYRLLMIVSGQVSSFFGHFDGELVYYVRPIVAIEQALEAAHSVLKDMDSSYLCNSFVECMICFLLFYVTLSKKYIQHHATRTLHNRPKQYGSDASFYVGLAFLVSLCCNEEIDTEDISSHFEHEFLHFEFQETSFTFYRATALWSYCMATWKTESKQSFASWCRYSLLNGASPSMHDLHSYLQDSISNIRHTCQILQYDDQVQHSLASIYAPDPHNVHEVPISTFDVTPLLDKYFTPPISISIPTPPPLCDNVHAHVLYHERKSIITICSTLQSILTKATFHHSPTITLETLLTAIPSSHPRLRSSSSIDQLISQCLHRLHHLTSPSNQFVLHPFAYPSKVLHSKLQSISNEKSNYFTLQQESSTPAFTIHGAILHGALYENGKISKSVLPAPSALPFIEVHFGTPPLALANAAKISVFQHSAFPNDLLFQLHCNMQDAKNVQYLEATAFATLS